MAQYFREAEDRQPVEVCQELDTLGRHTTSAQPIQAHSGNTVSELASQLCAVKVSRLFASCQKNGSARQSD
jgi:hypothetical protein